jgi:hypothetical protein
MAVEERYQPLAVYDLPARVELPYRADPDHARFMRRWLADGDHDGRYMVYVVKGSPVGGLPYEHTVFAFDSLRTARAFEERFRERVDE